MNFTSADLDYLANLCHNCAECYYACQYAPPHEFAVNVPKTLAEIRVRSYQHYAWPAALASVFRRNGWVAALALVIAFAIWIAATNGSTATSAQFYQVISHRDDGRGFWRCVDIHSRRAGRGLRSFLAGIGRIGAGVLRISRR